MLPKIIPNNTISPLYQEYISIVRHSEFSGDIRTDYAARLAVATDNSVYQVIPQAVILPKTTKDISIVLQISQQEKFKEVQFAPRGGGTGTNGQSLSSGVIIDCSKYMNQILEINIEENWVRVQPGVVLDQLNNYLKKQNLYFAPQISPSNRATLGGMINTDACGNGSRVLGRTSDHVLELTCVMQDGTIFKTTENISQNEKLVSILSPQQALIKEKFVSRPRNLNGYNLLKSYTDKINLNYLICGSEGTLAVVSECKLKINPIPKVKKLVLAKYKNFDDALRAHGAMTEKQSQEVVVIEAIDEKLIELAREDSIYFQIKDMMDGDVKSGGINLIEFVGNDETTLNQSIKNLCDNDKLALGFYIAKNETEVKLLWELRKKSVGLISKRKQGTRRPIPFVEDTAVPPEKLAEYIGEFKKLLDQHNLIYGMYGHVDAGCVHVRPALDLKQAEDEKLFKELSDKVAALVDKFGGVMWGEHGMGFRCSYAEHFFGEELYYTIRKIKTLFDPHNKLNPGKIAVPLNNAGQLVKLTEPLRGQFDKQISMSAQDNYANAMICNGNGACFNFSTQDAMCPSFKVTKDRIQSPKGRATVVREWLRQLQKLSYDVTAAVKPSNLLRKLMNSADKQDFSHEVYFAMKGCLSCKSCAFQCPLNVDVPEFKAKFLEQYHQRYMRPLRDYFVGATEKIAVLQSRFPKISNWFLQLSMTKMLAKKIIKMIDLPLVTEFSVESELKKRNAPKFDLNTVEKNNSVILLQDTFTTFYDSELVIKTYDFLTKLGKTVYVLPFFPNGKTLHVKGFLNKFNQIAKKNISYLNEIAKANIPMIGVDPSITLTYRDEYKKIDNKLNFNVMLLQEWLVTNIPENLLKAVSTKEYYLLSHCTEKTACVAAESQWQNIFSQFGLKLTPLAAGCCGMAGAYGHEVEHLTNSKALFAMDWEKYVIEKKDILVTGYSCRSQIKRLQGVQLKHPLEILFVT